MITPSFALTATERVLPRLALDFTTASLDPRVTFTRAGNTATVTNSSGLVAPINANLPRFDFDPITLACKGLLIEEARTNLQTYSEQFNHGSWTKFNTTVTADSTTAPDGTLTADSLIENTATSFHTIDGIYVAATATGNFTSSVYFKAKGRNFIRLYVTQETPGVNYSALFNLTTGVVVSSDVGVTASIVNAGNGWYRGLVSATILAASRARLTIGLQNASGALAPYTGDGTSGCYVWGAQIEVGAFPTSYIPTVASTVLRNADNASMTGTNFTSWYNQPQGTLNCSFIPVGTIANNTRIVELSGGTAARVADIYISGARGTVYNGTTTLSAAVGADTVLNTTYKVASAYATTNYGLSANATTVTTASSATVNTATALYIGSFNDGSNKLNGIVKTISYYPLRLTNAQLQAITK